MGLHHNLQRGRRQRSSDLRQSLGHGLVDSGENMSNSDRTLNFTDNSELNSSNFRKNPDWFKNLEADSSNEKGCISNSVFFALCEHDPVLPKDAENSDLYQSVDSSKVAKYLDVSSIMVDDEEFRKHLKQQQANEPLDLSDNTEERSIKIPQVLHNKKLQLRIGRKSHLQTEQNPFDDVMSDISSEYATQNQNDEAGNSSSCVTTFTSDKNNEAEASLEAVLPNKTHILRKRFQSNEISSYGAFDDAFEKSDNISSSELQNSVRRSVKTVLAQDQIPTRNSSFFKGAVLGHCDDDSLQTHLSEKLTACFGQKRLTDVQSSNNQDFNEACKPIMPVSKSKDVSQRTFEEVGVLEKSVNLSLTEPRTKSNDQSILVEGSSANGSVSSSKETETDSQRSASVFPPTSDCLDMLTDNVTFISNAERSASCSSSQRKMPINKISNYFQTFSTDSESSPSTALSSSLRAVDFVSNLDPQKGITNEGRNIQLDVPSFRTKSPHPFKESFSNSAVANHNNTTSNRSFEEISQTIDAEKKRLMLKSLFNVREEIINRKSFAKCAEPDCLSLKKPEKKNKEKPNKISDNYRVPRRKKPRPYVNNNMYAFIERKLALSFGLESRVKEEEFVVFMCSLVDSVIRREKKYFGLVKELRDKMLKLNLISKQIDFHLFIEKYLPYEFREKAIPCFGSSLGPPSISYEELYKPLRL